MSKKLKVLVTGSNGYLGARIAASLQNIGHSVVGSVRRFNQNSSLETSIETIEIDWSLPFDNLPFEKNFDVVVIASGMNAQDSERWPNLSFNIRGLRLAMFFDWCQKRGAKKFIYLSTVQVYGNSSGRPILEDKPCNAQTPYAKSHCIAERFLEAKSVQYPEITVIIARLSNAIGPPIYVHTNCWDLVANNFCVKAVLSEEVEIMGNSLTTRDFIPIYALCDFIDWATTAFIPKMNFCILNITSGKAIKIIELAEIVKKSYSIVFNRKISVKQNTILSESIDPVIFSNKKLTNLGFHMSQNIYKEITDCLVFCKNNQIQLNKLIK